MLAASLASDGVTTGDRIAYLGLNSPAFFVTLLAAFRLGAIFVPVNFRLAGPELVRVLNASGAKTLVCEEGHRGMVDEIRDDIHGHVAAARQRSGLAQTRAGRSGLAPGVLLALDASGGHSAAP